MPTPVTRALTKLGADIALARRRRYLTQASMAAADRFEISPDLTLVEGHQFRKAPSKDDSIFHFVFADTEPDGWGCRVIARDHAKRRKAAQAAGAPASAAALPSQFRPSNQPTAGSRLFSFSCQFMACSFCNLSAILAF